MGQPTVLFADGGIIADMRLGAMPGQARPSYNPSRLGGTWAWCAVDEAGAMVMESAGIIPAVGPYEATGVSNNLAEMQAAVRALEAMPDGWCGRLCSDSEVTLGRLFWDWQWNNIPHAWRKRADAARNRLGRVTMTLLAGHPTKAELLAGVDRAHGYPVSEWNVWCDKECTRLGKLYRTAWYELLEREQASYTADVVA